MLQCIEDFYTVTQKRKEHANPKGTSNYLSQYLKDLIITFYIAELAAKVLNQEERTKSDKKSSVTGERYLPEAAIKAISPAE